MIENLLCFFVIISRFCSKLCEKKSKENLPVFVYFFCYFFFWRTAIRRKVQSGPLLITQFQTVEWRRNMSRLWQKFPFFFILFLSFFFCHSSRAAKKSAFNLLKRPTKKRANCIFGLLLLWKLCTQEISIQKKKENKKLFNAVAPPFLPCRHKKRHKTL